MYADILCHPQYQPVAVPVFLSVAAFHTSPDLHDCTVIARLPLHIHISSIAPLNSTQSTHLLLHLPTHRVHMYEKTLPGFGGRSLVDGGLADSGAVLAHEIGHQLVSNTLGSVSINYDVQATGR
jgi:hypothetical protein